MHVKVCNLHCLYQDFPPRLCLMKAPNNRNFNFRRNTLFAVFSPLLSFPFEDDLDWDVDSLLINQFLWYIDNSLGHEVHLGKRQKLVLLYAEICS